MLNFMFFALALLKGDAEGFVFFSLPNLWERVRERGRLYSSQLLHFIAITFYKKIFSSLIFSLS